MDKYTVDLDKVLNDFEYSELTDQYGSPVTSYANNLPEQQQSSRSTPVKHTINNVFQSLNDYLNTDIAVKNTKHDITGCKEPEPNGLYQDLIPHLSLPEVNLELKVEEEKEVVPLINHPPIEEDRSTWNDCEVQETPVPQIVTESEDNFVAEPPALLPDIPNLCCEKDEELDLDETPPKSISEELKEAEVSILVATESLNEVESKFESDTDEEVCVKVDDEIVGVELKEESETEKDLQPPPVVSFDNFVDIDDSELHKYLDELENESEINQSVVVDNVEQEVRHNEEEVPCNPVVVVSCSEEEKCESVEDENVTSRPSTLQISSTQIDLVGEPGSTPYNNLYVTKALPKEEVPTESDIDSCESISPTFSTASTASAESIVGAVDVEEIANIVTIENVTVTNPADTANTNEEIGAAGNDALGDIAAASPNAILHNDSFDERQDDDDLTNLMGALKNDVRPEPDLGKIAPLWIPDADSLSCLHCDVKFTLMKRRHHCRACGYVLCSKCCNKKFKLEYLEAEARVCLRCYEVLNRDNTAGSSGSEVSPSVGNSPNRQHYQPNPNNPMEYCSTISPYQQVSATALSQPPSVMVPVGVLKRQGSSKTRTNKSVMFCDGIRPGSELTDLDNDFSYQPKSSSSKKGTSPPPMKVKTNAPLIDPVTNSYIPSGENNLPPTVTTFKSDISYTECSNDSNLIETLKQHSIMFALQNNLHVCVQIINMDCCINKWAWCFSSEGMITVGQDEIVYIVEFIDDEKVLPKDVFIHFANVYSDAKKGSSITENSISIHETPNFLDSKNHIGFLYIRPTFQCLQHVIIPKEPYLIGILIHRWEMPWAKIFPLRLVLRLGAEYRYYPSPIISTRHRESVFVEIGHTIINLLADFRNFSYTLPNIRGLTIHMEGKNTTIEIPSNRYEQVVKSLNNSSDHILAFGGNFSTKADSHLVCIQDTHGNNENTYTTHAINIHNRPRKVTGASFIVFNGALKSTSGLTAKSSIIEDGLMIQIPPEHMVQIRDSLRNMKNHTIQCGCVNATSDETVNIVWVDNDINFNTGVQSSIDGQPLAGVPSIRVHNGKDFVCSSGNRMIRWTEVFIIQNGDKLKGQEVDCSKLAESISKATCQALVKFLDLLLSNNFSKIGLRATLHVENVSYSAGSNGTKLPPIYMKSLDDELVPVLHRITTNNLGESMVILELVFRILNL